MLRIKSTSFNLVRNILNLRFETGNSKSFPSKKDLKQKIPVSLLPGKEDSHKPLNDHMLKQVDLDMNVDD